MATFVIHEHIPRRGSKHYDLRFDNPKTGKVASFAFGTTFPKDMERKAIGVRVREHGSHWLTKEGARLSIYDKGQVEFTVATNKYFHLTFRGNKLNGTYKLFPVKSGRGDNWLLVKPKSEVAVQSTGLDEGVRDRLKAAASAVKAVVQEPKYWLSAAILAYIGAQYKAGENRQAVAMTKALRTNLAELVDTKKFVEANARGVTVIRSKEDIAEFLSGPSWLLRMKERLETQDYLSDVLSRDKQKGNASAVRMGGHMFVVTPNAKENRYTLMHELGHLKAWGSGKGQDFPDAKGAMAKLDRALAFMSTEYQVRRGVGRYAVEVEAWDIAGVPKDNPVRAASLKTYKAYYQTSALLAVTGLLLVPTFVLFLLKWRRRYKQEKEKKMKNQVTESYRLEEEFGGPVDSVTAVAALMAYATAVYSLGAQSRAIKKVQALEKKIGTVVDTIDFVFKEGKGSAWPITQKQDIDDAIGILASKGVPAEHLLKLKGMLTAILERNLKMSGASAFHYGALRFVIAPPKTNDFVLRHELGHITQYQGGGKVVPRVTQGLSWYKAGLTKAVTFLSTKAQTKLGRGNYAFEVEAWDLAGVPPDNPIRKYALATYKYGANRRAAMLIGTLATVPLVGRAVANDLKKELEREAEYQRNREQFRKKWDPVFGSAFEGVGYRSPTLTERFLTETIVKKGNEYCLYSKDGSRNLGCYPNREGAVKRERQVQFFKHMKG